MYWRNFLSLFGKCRLEQLKGGGGIPCLLEDDIDELQELFPQLWCRLIKNHGWNGISPQPFVCAQQACGVIFFVHYR